MYRPCINRVEDHLSHGHNATPSNSTLTAAALQDHLSRQYNLSHSLPLRLARNKGKVSSKSTQNTKQGSSCSSCGATGVRSKARLLSNEKVVAGKKLVQKEEIKSINGITADTEYVLDKAPPPLTLAQRLGLVGAPPRLLDEQKWKTVKESSIARHDSSLPCSICQEPFGLSTQVLLSCSHVFHFACLTSFEKFSQKKQCPLCRRVDYQKRVIYEGAHYWRHRAATIIQSQWRGYVVRKWYKNYRDKVPPKNPQLRMKHFERKLTSLTELMVKSCDQHCTQAESILVQSDINMSAIRDALKLYERQSLPTSIDWDEVRIKAKEHLSSDCSICLGSLLPSRLSQTGEFEVISQSNSDNPPTLSCSKSQVSRPISLLSCGHLLHTVCIEALEKFASEGTLHLCPLCRAPYQKIPFQLLR